MKELVIHSKKNSKIREKDLVEIDYDDLEFFGHLSHGREFLKIPSSIVDKKTILEWFAQKNFSSWWFASPVIHPKYKEAMVFIERFMYILDKYKPDIIRLKGIFDKKSIIEQLCEIRGIQLIISNKDYSFYKIRNKIKTALQKSFYKKILDKKTKKRIDCFDSRTFQRPTKGYALIISPGIYRRKNFDPNLNKSVIEEFYIKPFLDFFNKENIPTLCVDVDYTFRGNIEILNQRLESSENWIPLEYLLINANSKTIKNSIYSLERSLSKFLKYNLDDVFKYKEISLWDFLKPTFQSLFFEPYFPFYFDLMEKFEKFLRETKPSVIIQVYEAGPYAKAIELAAEKVGIKTIGIQHGLIPSDYPDYMAPEIRSKKSPLGNIIPDLTLVFGPFYERLLTQKGNYPSESVVSIGNPSFYNIKNIQNTLSKSKSLKKKKNRNKTILVPLSFRLIKKTPDREILDSLYSNYKNSKEINILVHPHPGDSISKEELEKIYPRNNFLLSKNSLAEDLYSCDIVVVLPTSTVSTDAILFQKPVILINILNNNEQIDSVYLSLVENKLAKMISIKVLKPTIESIIQNNYELDNKRWINFVNDFFNYNKVVDFSKIL